MGYYENPPIIQPAQDTIGSSIARAGESIAQGLIARGERRRAEEKEQKLTLQKLQDRKNETDLFYNEKMSKWSEKQSSINPEINKQIRDIVQQKVIDAADARIALLNETNATKRQEYLTTIRNADNILENAAKAGKSLGGVAATYRLKAKASTIGKPGGYVVNGKDDNEILDNTAFVESLSGMTNGNPLYKSSSLSVSLDDEGDGFIVTASGQHADGRTFNVPINTKSYIDAEENLDDGLLLPVESMDTFFTQARETVSNKDGVFKGFLEDTHETYDLDSSGGDIYQIKNGRRLQEKVIRDQINKKSEVTASGILAADAPSRLKALLNYSLEQGPQYYDEVFKVDEKGNVRSSDVQKQMLTQLLTEKSFQGLVKDFERTTDKKGNVTYWNPSSDVQIKDKPEKTGGGTNGGNNNTEETDIGGDDYRGEYYDALIKGPKRVKGESEAIYAYRSRQDYAKNLNRLAGSTSKFITTDDLYKKFLQEPIKKGATVTFAEQITAKKLTKEQVKQSFNSRFPKSDMYYEQSPGDYRALSNYNLNKASSRAKLALDFTAGEGEIKKLQGKVGKAKLQDWINANPRKPGESDAQYVARYKNQ